MSGPILTTKLYIPSLRPKVVLRPRLIEQLNGGLHRKLTLISAPAGFGKTALISEWVHDLRLGSSQEVQKLKIENREVAWLSLDAEHNDMSRFLTYVVAALGTIVPADSNFGQGVLAMLQSPQPPPSPSILTALLNEIAAIPIHFIFVLDDYHVLDAPSVNSALSFLLDHLPPHMHLVVLTREDPPLPLARLRVRDQLTELRVAELRFTLDEVARFLNEVMGLSLATEAIAALERRTEGWIAGLQLAALSLQGHPDATHFIKSFTGSHRFVLDYLVEEVLQQQPESVQTFLLYTSILDRLCGPLCEAVCAGETAVFYEGTNHVPIASGQETLTYIEHANLFIVPLDNERRWYRYHHLFAGLLRQRLQQRFASSGEEEGVAALHRRASMWYEANGLEVEAFHHAAAANDIGRAERLIEGEGMPLHFRGVVTPILNWLASLPTAVLDAWPSLWTTYASVLLVTGQTTAVEATLQAAEVALQATTVDDKTKDLIGRVAAIRATVAANRNEVETIINESHRALALLHPDNLSFRTSTTWKLGYAYHLRGDRDAAGQAYNEVVAIGQASGNVIFTIMAMIGLAGLQEDDNDLQQAVKTYQHVLQLFGEQPLPVAGEVHLGLARVFYEWNRLDLAYEHGQQSLQLAQRIENSDRFIASELFLACLKLAQGDVMGVDALLGKAEQFVRRHHFEHRLADVTAVRVRQLLKQGDVQAAARVVATYELPLSQARVYLAQAAPSAALSLLAPMHQQAMAKGWPGKRLKVMVLEAMAHSLAGEMEKGLQLLDEALALAEPGGFVRTFVDEGHLMIDLLSKAVARGMRPTYIDKLLTAFHVEAGRGDVAPSLLPLPPVQPLIEPLSRRELEILQLVAQGLSNREISERLFLALNTVKGHNRRIYGKLQVQRRTEAVARARELGLL